MFFLSVIVITLLTAALPLYVRPVAMRLKVTLHPAQRWLPVVAAVLFAVSFYLPDVHISNETSTFQQHFVGGGMYSAALFVYARQLLDWKFHWVVELVLLFAWTSAFGVANKLLEFALLKLHLSSIDTSDAYWDLLANTVGAFVGYVSLAFLTRRD